MSSAVLRTFWPYDEVSVAKDRDSQAVVLSTPWLKIRLTLPVEHIARAQNFFEKLNSGLLSGADLGDVNWFFSSLAEYPLTYTLPRAEVSGLDQHEVLDSTLNFQSPTELLLSLTASARERETVIKVALQRLPAGWTWDRQAALDFSRNSQGIDPVTLFSIARRFHLLNDLEWNRTAEMLEFVQNLKNQPEAFRQASALVLRQNHYITQQCESVLREALPIAQSAEAEVLEFIRAESGHDRILAKALKSLGIEPEQVTALPVTKTLMEVFRFVAKRNLLAFAMIVDIFERTSYREEDPVTTVLKEGGEQVAARQIDIHREINDMGGHENVAAEFLNSMAAVNEAYAHEALLLAELATLVMHQVSAETLDVLKA